jgi:hypothetical protein
MRTSPRAKEGVKIMSCRKYVATRCRGLLALCILVAAPFILGAADGRKTVAQVGRAEITGTDIDRRFGVEKAYGNKTADRGTALASLINDSLESEVAAVHGAGPTNEEIATFRKYVDENSRSPELLAKVKKVFGKDGRAYERLYLAPRIANRKLHYFYSRDPLIHQAERAKIEKAYGMAASGRALKDVAAELGLEYRDLSPKGEDKQDVPPAFARHFTAEEWKPDDPLLPIVEKLTNGQLYNNIIEDDLGYQVFRLLEKGKEKGRYSAEAVFAGKRPFDEWFREEAAKVKIAITDAAMKKKVRSANPELWWIKRIDR